MKTFTTKSGINYRGINIFKKGIILSILAFCFLFCCLPLCAMDLNVKNSVKDQLDFKKRMEVLRITNKYVYSSEEDRIANAEKVLGLVNNALKGSNVDDAFTLDEINLITSILFYAYYDLHVGMRKKPCEFSKLIDKVERKQVDLEDVCYDIIYGENSRWIAKYDQYLKASGSVVSFDSFIEMEKDRYKELCRLGMLPIAGCGDKFDNKPTIGCGEIGNLEPSMRLYFNKLKIGLEKYRKYLYMCLHIKVELEFLSAM